MICFSELGSSKSAMNRWLILQSYFPGIQLIGSSGCDDVIHLKKCLSQLAMPTSSSDTFDVGDGGTTFRFFALRASRIPGCYRIRLSSSLARRPQSELVDVLSQVGVQSELQGCDFLIDSSGWKPAAQITVSAAQSTQFVSSVLLNAVGLNWDLNLKIEDLRLSKGYFDMTLDCMRLLQIQFYITEVNGHWVLKLPQQDLHPKVTVEVPHDMSSAFAACAFGLVSQGLQIKPFRHDLSQPDSAFIEILQKLRFALKHENNEILVPQLEAKHLNENKENYHLNLQNSPDLFPVLASLLTLKPGRHVLMGAPHLIHKESNRIESTLRLLKHFDFEVTSTGEGMTIMGIDTLVQWKEKVVNASHFQFDPRKDHRLVMAAQIFKLAGALVSISDEDCVRKSMPEYFDLVKSLAGSSL